MHSDIPVTGLWHRLFAFPPVSLIINLSEERVRSSAVLVRVAQTDCSVPALLEVFCPLFCLVSPTVHYDFARIHGYKDTKKLNILFANGIKMYTGICLGDVRFVR